jgi:mono/diheme cytochrome c family protein
MEMSTRFSILGVLLGGTFLMSSCGPSQSEANPKQTTSVAESKNLSGRELYAEHCSACHGAEGDGNGPASVWLFPKPRNFSAGLFKIQSSPAGSLPTDEDIYESITRGLPGSSMPSFNYLSEAERRELVKYVKELTAVAGEDGVKVNHFEKAAEQGQAPAAIEVPPEPPATLEALTRGKELFAKLQCNTCHGDNGAGDGPAALTLKDNWGIPLPPRDFNTGLFRGGSQGRDLYLRIAVGMAGTPMPAFGDDLITREDRWALVHYIQSLRRKDVEIGDILAPEDGRILAFPVSSLPGEPLDPVWEKYDPVRVPLNPLWPEPNPVPAVSVKALHDGKRLVLLLQWKDEIKNGSAVKVQDFQDSAAIQFSMNGKTPFLGMGSPFNPVNIWHWKAGWQQAVGDARPDVNTEYPSMHADMYPENGVLFKSAESVGNLLSQTSIASPVEDANAQGFGTLRSQSAKGQNVKGKGVWNNGHWSVLVTRELSTRESEDVQFRAEKSVPVAFAIWDGQNRDRNGRKLISNWYQLHVQK